MAQILKSRDDPKPIRFESVSVADGGVGPQFCLADDAACAWQKSGVAFGPDTLRKRIEPWLTALCQSEHLSVLFGSGLAHAVHGIATAKPLPGMGQADFGAESQLLDAEAGRSAKAAGRASANIEDQIRVTNELLRGLEILGTEDAALLTRAEKLRERLASVLAEFAGELLGMEARILHSEDLKRQAAFNYLVSFLMSFASRSGTRERLNLFTTNYDRLIEAGAEMAGLRLLDRFVGTLAPVFRSSRLNVDMHYNPPGIRGEPRYLEGIARFTKLHGSLDWIDWGGEIRRIALPFGVASLSPFLTSQGDKEASAQRVMIYPNSAKDRETAAYPYVELFRDLAAAACQPNSTLVTYGYSFGDEHINRVVEDMLTIPSTHLVVIAFDDPLDRIMKLYERWGRHAQVSLMIGDHLGDMRTLVDHYLPKPAIDRTTFRMSELLKSRWGTEAASTPKPQPDDETGAES